MASGRTGGLLAGGEDAEREVGGARADSVAAKVISPNLEACSLARDAL